MNEQTLKEITVRLLRVEEQNRRYRWCTISLLTILCAGLLMGQTRLTLEERTIAAEKFVLEDAERNARAVLALIEGEPKLCLYDSDGVPRAWLGFATGSPMLSLSGKSGNPGMLLSVTEDAAVLGLHDTDGRPALALACAEGGGGLEVYNKHDQVCVKLGAKGKEGESVLLLVGRDENGGASLRAREEGPCLSFFGKSNGPGLMLYLDEGRRGLSLFDEDRNLRATLSLHQGDPALGLIGKDGKVAFRAP